MTREDVVNSYGYKVAKASVDYSQKYAKDDELQGIVMDTFEDAAEFVKTYREHLGEQISPIPVWSLASLLNILPHCIDEGYDLTLGKLSDNNGWYVMYDDVDHFVYIYIAKSNLIDACVEMIVRLKEDNLI